MNKGKTKKEKENINRMFIPKEFIRSKRNEKKTCEVKKKNKRKIQSTSRNTG